MVFNVLIDNKDDHAKNFSFILKNGEWKLSPAFEIFYPMRAFNGYHTTTVRGKGTLDKEDVFCSSKKSEIGYD